MQNIQKAEQRFKSEIKEKEATLDKVRNKNYEKKKNNLLIKMGLYEKEYMPEDGKVEDYPKIEQNDNQEIDRSSTNSESMGRRFRYKPWAVSDEDFERLKALHEKKKSFDQIIKHEKNPDKPQKPIMNNTIGHYIRVAAITLLIIYGLAGIIFIAEREELFGIVMIVSGVLTALLYYGFSEVIRLLQEQVNQNK